MLARVRLARWGGPVDAGRVAGSRLAWSTREGLLLALEDDDGNLGFGEATPLPGFSRDTIEDAERALAGFDWENAVQLLRGDPTLNAVLSGRLEPSARFAVETAWIDLAGRRRGVCASELLGAAKDAAIPVSALAGRLDEDPIEEASRSIERGAAAIKLKSSGRDLMRDREALARIREAVGPSARLRIDFGGSLAARDVPAWLVAFHELGVEAVEEPCTGADLVALGPMAVPWLADESLVEPPFRDALLASPACAGVVLKPTVLGGLRACLDLARRAVKHDKMVIVTHAFEGPVALAACAALALGCGAALAGVDDHAALGAFPALPSELRAGGVPLATRAGRGAGLALESASAVYDRAFSASSGRTLWER